MGVMQGKILEYRALRKNGGRTAHNAKAHASGSRQATSVYPAQRNEAQIHLK